MFLTKVAVYFWITSVGLLLLMAVLKATALKGLSSRMLVLNSGFIFLGIPFNLDYNVLFRIIGGMLISIALALIIKAKWRDKK